MAKNVPLGFDKLKSAVSLYAKDSVDCFHPCSIQSSLTWEQKATYEVKMLQRLVERVDLVKFAKVRSELNKLINLYFEIISLS